jgi:ribosomal-protein-alanine N-acetyltransferase
MFQTELSPGSYRFAVGGAFLRQDGTEGDPVGYVISHVLPEEVQILNVAVHPDHRRRGIARRLLSAVLNTAGEEGILRAVLEVRESNAVAQSLYRSFGFKIVGRRKGYYSAGHEDALTMVLQGTMPLFPKDYVLELRENK